MKKLRVFLLILVVLAALAFFGGSALLERSSRQVLPLVAQALTDHGLAVSELDFGGARIASHRSVVWKNVSARIRLPDDSAAQGQSVRVDIGEAELVLADLGLRRFWVDLRGLTAGPDAGLASGFEWASSRFKEAARQGRLIAPHLRAGLEVDLRQPRPGLKRLSEEVLQVLHDGSTTLPLVLDAGILTRLEVEELWAGLRVVEQADFSRIEVDREDLRRLAQNFSRPLTEGEIDLVAEHPLRAPAMLFVKKYAETTAGDAHQADSTVPEDAYRHVLWSFLLTKRFGSEFAESVTDAHEVGSTTNTEADHRMDYNNNAVGRSYAAAGLSESEILGKVRTDRKVIRQAR